MKQVKLGDLGEIISGSTPQTNVKEYWEGGTIPWVTPADLTEHTGIYFEGSCRKITEAGLKNCSSRMLPPRSILFTSRAPIGYCAVTQTPLCTNQGFKSIIPNEKLNSVYGFYALSYKTPEIVAKGRGATFSEVTKEIMAEIEIPLPSLNEQRRIAGILDQADRLRRHARQQTDTFLQSVFIQMFGDPIENPRNYPIKLLGESLEGFEGGVNFNPVSEGEKCSEWRVLKISAVSWGDFDAEASKPIQPDVTFDEKLVVRKNDLLMSRANTTELVGAVCIVRNSPLKVLLPDKIWRLPFAKTSELLPDYTLFALRDSRMRSLIGRLATGTSGSMKNISKEKAAALPIPVPPLVLQEKFAEAVKIFEKTRQQANEAERQAEMNFQALLHRAFSGQLLPEGLPV